MSNLILIDETSVSTPANSISITNVFSADYDTYCIQIVGTSAASSAANNFMDMRLINSSDSIISSTLYEWEYYYARGFSATFLNIGGTSRDEYTRLYHDDDALKGFSNMTMWIFSPFQSDSYTFHVQQSAGYGRDAASASIPIFHKGIGVLKQESSITGYNWINRNSINIASGTFRTYGLKVN